MVFFLAEIGDNPDSESKSAVKYYILSGLLLCFISIGFFVFKLKTKPAHSGQSSNPNEKENTKEESVLMQVEKPKTEGKGQEVNDLNSGADSKTNNAPEPNKDFSAKKEEVLNPERIGNPPAEKTEEPKQIKLEPEEKPKIEAKVEISKESEELAVKEQVPEGSVLVENAKTEKKEEALNPVEDNQATNNEEPKLGPVENKEEPKLGPDENKEVPKPEQDEKKDSIVEKNEAIEQVQAKPTEKEEELKPEPATEKVLQSPGEVAELAKATEEELNLFKQIEEQLEKVNLPVLESKKKETQQKIQQRIQMAVSVFIENNYTVKKIEEGAVSLWYKYLYIRIFLLNKEKNSCKIDLGISTEDLTINYEFLFDETKENMTFQLGEEIRDEDLSELKKIFKKKILGVEEKRVDFYIKVKKMQTLYLNALNNCFTKEELKGASVDTEEKSKFYVDLEKNEAIFKEVITKILFCLFDKPLIKSTLQTKKLEITDKKYCISTRPGLPHSLTITFNLSLTITFNLVDELEQIGLRVCIEDFSIKITTYRIIGNTAYDEDIQDIREFPIEAQLIFDEVKPK